MMKICDELKELVAISAPSGKEGKRAEYILNRLQRMGYTQAFIDKKGNVIVIIEAADADASETVAFGAHIDTVFPYEHIKIIEDDSYLRAPGIGDDTANVVLLINILEDMKLNDMKPKVNLMFIFDVCEEGLGNLKGIKEIFWENAVYAIKRFYAIDLGYDSIYNRIVGSRRYEAVVRAKGGHSYKDFGNESAIAKAADCIRDIYSIATDEYDDATVTYNVGTIQGGTSVNAIADRCTFTIDMRSDNAKCLEAINEKIIGILDGYGIGYSLIGDRPAGEYDDSQRTRQLYNEIDEMTREVSNIIVKNTGIEPVVKSGSTDCNIPVSMGIPAICFGGYIGGGTHSDSEWIDKKSLVSGYNIIKDVVMRYVTV